VEITIALAVAGFCLLAVVGLLQTGVTSERDTVDRTVATDILSRVFQDLAGTPRTNTLSPEFKLNTETNGIQTIWFSDVSTTNASAGGARYRASVSIVPPGGSNWTATSARLLVTWPAAADPNGSSLPSKYSGAVEVATTLERR
jgi:hypothetical protein